MATRTPLDIKTTEKAISPVIERYPDSLVQFFAILIAHFENQRVAPGSSNEDMGKEVFSEQLTAASSLMATHRGSHIQSSGNVVQASFSDSKDAVKAAIAIHQMIETLNHDKNPQSRLHVKAGIDYGEVIRDADDIQGSAVDTARLLKDIATPDEICVSWKVFSLSRGIPSVHFEIVHSWNKKNVPEGLEMYRIVWDAAHDTSTVTYPILCFRPVWKLWDQTLAEAWEELITNRHTLWGREQESEAILGDKSILLILKRIESIIPLSMTVSAFLRKKMRNLSVGLIPIQIIADIGSNRNGWKEDKDSLPALWERLNPGYLYIAEHAYNPLQQKTEIPGNPVHRFYGEHSFYQVALDNELASQERKHFLYRKALVRGDFHPCFYCGDKKHQPVNCPSKNIPETTNALNQLGYLSIDELNTTFYHYIMEEKGSEESLHTVDLFTEGSLSLAASGFFELKRIFQLRFFRSFWNTSHEEWNKVRKNRNQSEGGLIWLAQDSLRVSELTKAESMLSSAMNKYPLDYRVYVASGFLHIEKNDLSRAEYYFSEASTVANTNVQKAFTLLLLSRLYWIAGNLQKAHEKVQRVLSLDIDSVDALYQDMVFKFLQGKDKIASQRLSRLVQEDKEYFVSALIDPDLASYSHIIGETLGILLDRARKEAQSAVSDADNEYALSRVALRKSDINDIQLLQTKIGQLSEKDSYFGYLDIIDHCNAIIATCRNSTIHRKREIWEIFRELNKRLETNMRFVDSYPYKAMVSSYREQLASAREKIHRVQNIGPALSQEQLIACHNLHEELTEEWGRLESRLRKLSALLKLNQGSLRFLRWSGIFMAIIWFLGLFLFPLIIYYLNAFLSGFDVSTMPNVWFYQKNFLLFGSLVGMSVSLFITIKSFFAK
jgi:class 3 adenylate cyclase/tetratricopeptide (TPR) repeat protein